MARIHMQSSLETEENRDCVLVRSPGRHKTGNNSHGTSPYKEIGKGLNLHCQISPVEPIKVAPPYRAPSGPRPSYLTAAANGQSELPTDFFYGWPMQSQNGSYKYQMPQSSRGGHDQSSVDEGRSDLSGTVGGATVLRMNINGELRKSAAKPFDMESTH